MEVAGTVLGVLPLIVEALKAYREACEKFKTCRHYSSEVRTVKRYLEKTDMALIDMAEELH